MSTIGQTNLGIGDDRDIQEWISGVTYQPNDEVSHLFNVYISLVCHVSTDFATDLGAGKWVLVGGAGGIETDPIFSASPAAGITTNEALAMSNANAPSALNPFATIADLVAEDLAATLTAGNTTSDGQSIQALNGGGYLNLRADATDNCVRLGNDPAGGFAKEGVWLKDDYAALFTAAFASYIQMDDSIGGGNNSLDIFGSDNLFLQAGTGDLNIKGGGAGTVTLATPIANQTATFQNSSGTLAYLTDITGDGIYDGSGTVGAGTVATLTDSLTFRGVGTVNGAVRFAYQNSASTNLFTIEDGGRIQISNSARLGIGADPFGVDAFLRVAQSGSSATRGAYITASTGATALETLASSGAAAIFRNIGGASFEDTVIIDRATGGVSTRYGGLTFRASTPLDAAAGQPSARISWKNTAGDTAGNQNGEFRIAVMVGGSYSTAFLINAGDNITAQGGRDFETVTNATGFVVLDRTDGNRYRIYTDGGVLNTELVP